MWDSKTGCARIMLVPCTVSTTGMQVAPCADLSAPVQVWVLWVCASLLLMRGIMGVLSDYEGTEYTYMCASAVAVMDDLCSRSAVA